MNDQRLSNRAPPPPSREALRASLDHAIAECDRLATMPAGHPEAVQAFCAGRLRIIHPTSVSPDAIDAMRRLAYGGEPEIEATPESSERKDSEP